MPFIGLPFVLIAASNRPDILDPDLLRMGRFARWIVVDCPDPPAAAVAAHDFAVVKRVTASFGVAQCHHENTPDTLFGRADQALYRAKERGRDRVEVAE